MAGDFVVRFRRARDMMSLDFHFFGVERSGKTLSAAAQAKPRVVIEIPSQYVAEEVHLGSDPVTSWLPSQSLAAKKSLLSVDIEAALPMPYDADSILGLLSLPLTAWPGALPDGADPTLGGPTAEYPATFLELSHNLVLSPYSGTRLRARRPPTNASVTDLWTIVLNGETWTGAAFTDRAKLRAVKSRDVDAFRVTLTSNDRKQLVAITNTADSFDRAIHADTLRLTPLGASGKLLYDQEEPPEGYDLVLWRKEIAVGRDVLEKVSYRGVLWPWMLPAIFTKTTPRRFFNAQQGVPDAATSLVEQFEITLKRWDATFAPSTQWSFPWTRVVVDRAFTTTGSIDREVVAKVKSTKAGIEGDVVLPFKDGVEFGFPLTLYDRDGKSQTGPHPAIFVPDFNGTVQDEHGVPHPGAGNDPDTFNAAFTKMSEIWATRPRKAPLAALPERNAPVAVGATRWVEGTLFRCVQAGMTATALPRFDRTIAVQYVPDGEVTWHAVTAALGDLALHDAAVSFVQTAGREVALPALTVTVAAPTRLKDGLITPGVSMVKAAVTVPSIRDLGEIPYVAIALHDTYVNNGFGSLNPGELFARVLAASPSITGIDPSKLVERPVLAFPTGGLGGLSRKVGAVLADVNDPKKLEQCLDDALTGTFDPAKVFAAFKNQLPTLLGFIPLSDILSIGSFAGDVADQVPVVARQIVGDVTGPHTITAAYEYTTDIKTPSGPLVAPKNGKSQLVMKVGVTTVVSLPPTLPVVSQSLTCSIKNLRLLLLETPEIVQITVDDITFKSETGKAASFAINGLHVDLQGAMQFVQGIVETLGLGGWSIRPIDAGMLASFGVKLGPLQLGAFALDGLSFNSGLTLPFDGSEMRFVFGLATRLRPFTLMVGIFGGGGFLEIDVLPGTKRLIVDAAIQFQGGFALDLGVASGAVYLAAGIEFKIDTGTHAVTLTGFVRCGGCLDVLGIISVSIMFYLGLSYMMTPQGSAAYGECEVIVEVHVLFFSASVSLHMRRQFAGSAQPQSSRGLDTFAFRADSEPPALAPSRRFSDYVSPTQFAEYLSAFEV